MQKNLFLLYCPGLTLKNEHITSHQGSSTKGLILTFCAAIQIPLAEYEDRKAESNKLVKVGL